MEFKDSAGKKQWTRKQQLNAKRNKGTKTMECQEKAKNKTMSCQESPRKNTCQDKTNQPSRKNQKETLGKTRKGNWIPRVDKEKYNAKNKEQSRTKQWNNDRNQGASNKVSRKT